jgi:CubicO group peptidase (beta-lactamase class C family)
VRVDLAELVAAAGFEAPTPVAVAACSRDGAHWTHVQGSWPDGSAADAHDRFYTASLSKQVTGAVVAVLARQRRFDPDAPVGRFVPSLPGWAEQLTTRQLLHHRGGLPPDHELGFAMDRDWTNGVAMATVRQVRTVAADAPYVYSNLGYVLVARVVESVVGLPFGNAARTLVLQPLGLDAMSFEDDLAGFRQTSLMGPGLPLSRGDGGLWATAGAFVSWLDHQNRDTLGIAGIVQSGMPLADGSTGDYGWGIGLRAFRGLPLYIHGGEWRGATAKAVRSPRLGIGAAVLTAGAAWRNIDALVDRMLDALADA